MELRIAGIMRDSIVDGPGMRFTVFAQGCPHHCLGCHNPATHSSDGGFITSTEKILAEFAKSPYTAGITLSGGEPLEQEQLAPMLELAQAVVDMGKNVVIFTGYTYEQLQKMSALEPMLAKLLSLTFLLIDGPFILAQRDLSLPLAGSRNQRVLDMQKTLAKGEPVLYSI